jgi:hypothetical protein
MIDIEQERVFSFADAAPRLPRRRGGKPVNVATLHRWAMHGCKGVKLETIQIGGIRCTSLGALQRFFDALTSAATEPGRNAAATRRPAPIRRRRRDDAAVAAEQDRLGF